MIPITFSFTIKNTQSNFNWDHIIRLSSSISHLPSHYWRNSTSRNRLLFLFNWSTVLTRSSRHLASFWYLHFVWPPIQVVSIRLVLYVNVLSTSILFSLLCKWYSSNLVCWLIYLSFLSFFIIPEITMYTVLQLYAVVETRTQTHTITVCKLITEITLHKIRTLAYFVETCF